MYHILKQEKATRRMIGFLSPNKKRWIPINSKHKIGLFTEQDVEAFKAEHSDDPTYYYHKSQKHERYMEV